ncbi:MAG: hypothetical protein ACYCWW_17715, partial [Deltaproteobacteria bacterium]
MPTAEIALTPADARPRLAPEFPGHWLLGAGRQFQRDPLGVFFEASDRCGDVARVRFPIHPKVA